MNHIIESHIYENVLCGKHVMKEGLTALRPSTIMKIPNKSWELCIHCKGIAEEKGWLPLSGSLA